MRLTRFAAACGVLGGIVWSGQAHALECEDLGEAEFRSLVLDAQAAIDRGNLVLPGEILYEIEQRVPCLTFAPAPRMWADLMVARAIIEYRAAPQSRAWKDSLYAALRIRPMVDRGVSEVHPIARWDPTDDPDWSPPSDAPMSVPPDRQIFVDGMKDSEVPVGGLTLVQRTDGKYWNSVLVDSDESLVEGWLGDDVEQPARIRWWLRIGASSGLASVAQDPGWATDVWVAGGDAGPSIGAIADLQLTFYSPFGLLVQGEAAAARQSPGYHLQAAGVWTTGGLTLGMGPGTAAADTYELGVLLDEDETPPTTATGGTTGVPATDDPSDGLVESSTVHRFTLLRYWMVTGMYRTRGDTWKLDGGLSVGAGAAIGRLDLDAGITSPRIGAQRVRLGLHISGQNARFTPLGLPDRVLSTSSTRALVRLDLVFGEDY